MSEKFTPQQRLVLERMAPGQALAAKMDKVLGEASFEDRFYAIMTLATVTCSHYCDGPEQAKEYLDSMNDLAKGSVASAFQAKATGTTTQ